MSSVHYYNAEEVNKVLTWPLVNEAVKASFEAVSKNEDNTTISSYANQPSRTITQCGTKGNQLLLSMPAFVGNYEMSPNPKKHNTLAVKLVTSFLENTKLNPPVPNILAHILVFNSVTGQLDSIVEGTQITAWRTASASIVATKYLYFERDGETNADKTKAINVAIIGCGVEGNSHALGMCATYNVSNIYLWNRTVSKAESLAEKLRIQYPNLNVHISKDTATAVADADVICIGTYSANALINYDMIKKNDVHINTIGAGQVHFGEVAQDIYDNAAIYVDSWANAKVELKDLKAEIAAEVGELIRSGKRPNKKGITLFQSMGMAAEDATVAQAIVDAIQAAKIVA